ncbi:MAG: SoxR reducing system RseC family protein [Bacteroidales bacterium]|nr:SoxR reducing system RseC family protein [Bacteroidales bacterium]
MSKNITHDGVVVAIDGQDVHVMIVQHSACAGCHAKGACTASDSKDKIIIAKSRGEAYQIGEQVLLVGSNSMAWSALAYAFILPLILSIALLFVVSGIVSEAMSCLFVLALLAIYYFILFLFRSKLETKFVFYIEKQL